MVSQAVEQIKDSTNFYAMDESATKQGVVLRLLSAVGWDTFDINQVVPEYTVGSRRVDYALLPGTANTVFLEVKRPGEKLERHQQQLLEYCFQEGVRLAGLTSGRTWWFYLPLQAGSWEQRRFLTIDLDNQAPNVMERKFLKYLSPKVVDSGHAVRSAEALVESRQRTEKTSKAIADAWKQIIETPDELLVELITEAAERMCGFRPETDLVQHFLAQNIPRAWGSPLEPEMPSHRQPPARKGPTSAINQRVSEGRQGGPLPITLEPASDKDFLAALLQAGRAWLEVSYNDGRKEVSPWNASRMSRTSNVKGNLRSRPQFRAGAWQAQGIASLRATIERPNDS